MNFLDAIKTYFIHMMSLFTLVAVLVFGYKFHVMSEKLENEQAIATQRYNELINTQTQYVQLTKQVAQLSTVYQDQKALKNQLDSIWKAVKLSKTEQVNSTQTTSVNLAKIKTNQSKSDFVFLAPKGENTGYTLNELRIAGKDSPALGSILVNDNGSVEKTNYNLTFKLESVQITDEKTGKVRVISQAYLVPQENGLADTQPELKKWAGVEYPLPVTGGQIEVDPKQNIVTVSPPENYIKDALLIGGGVLGFIIFKNPMLLKFW
jgi:hypothetical protein